MTAHTPQLMADILHLFNVPLRISDHAAEMILHGFQHIFYAHSGHSLIQRRHTSLLEILNGGSGAVRDPLPQVGQHIPCPFQLVFQIGDYTLHDLLHGRLFFMGKLGLGLLQFLDRSVKLTDHIIHIQ